VVPEDSDNADNADNADPIPELSESLPPSITAGLASLEPGCAGVGSSWEERETGVGVPVRVPLDADMLSGVPSPSVASG
jgi:hypothetical protein